MAGFPMCVAAEQAVSIEPEALLPASGASVAARVHRLELRDGSAYYAQTLDGGELTLRGMETRPSAVKVSVFAGSAWFAP